MSAITAPLSTPRRDDTARDALRNVARTERPVRGPLTISLAEVVATCYIADWLSSPLGRALVAQASRARGRE